MKRNLPIVLAVFLGLCIATCNAFGQGISEVLEAAEAATPGPTSLDVDSRSAPASGIDKLIADENAAFEAGYRTAEAAMRGQEIQPEPGLEPAPANEHSVLTPAQQADADKHGLTAQQYKAIDAKLDELEREVAERTKLLHALLDEWEAAQKPAQFLKPPTINWRSALNERARDETRQAGKLGFIMFTLNDNCAACLEDEKRYFQDPKIVERLNEHYVCVKVDASKIAPSTLRRWGVKTVPHYIVTDANWNLPGTRLQRWTPDQFYERLEVIQTPRDRNVSSTTKYPTRFAVYRRTGYEVDENYVSSEPQAEATQLDLNEPPTGWRPRATASYASNGSQGGYGGAANYGERIVYVQAAPSYGTSYGSSGGAGGYSQGYGSSGGAGGYGWSQPAYYQPSYQPAYYGGGYSSGQVVCSDGVCWVQ